MLVDGRAGRTQARSASTSRSTSRSASNARPTATCPDNIVDFVGHRERIFPIGRLDKDSEGLILLTNDGDIVNRVLRAEHEHEKEYIVAVDRPLTPEFLAGMASGVPILDTVTNPCSVRQVGRNTFRIVLTQGLNRQIRRMCEHFDYTVRGLQRVRIMHIQLGDLPVGPLAQPDGGRGQAVAATGAQGARATLTLKKR